MNKQLQALFVLANISNNNK